jgi:adenylate cyclase
MGDAVDRMKAGLRSFERYIPVELVRELLRSGREARLGGETRELTIHFSDIAGFTGIAERMAPDAIVAELGEYFELMTRILRQHEGTVDKFMGDGILAFFNAPRPVSGHAAQACRAALEAQASLGELAARREAAGRPVFRARIGLEIGEVLVGNIGTPDRFAYTVIGDAVNLASRLEGLNKFYGTSIIGTERLREAAGPGFEWRRLDRVAVVGRREGTQVSELLGVEGRTPADILDARDAYEMALASYLAGDFGTALAGFHAALDARPDDLAAATMVRRTRKLKRAPPADWTGIYVQTQK